jgi:hypothetical protein
MLPGAVSQQAFEQRLAEQDKDALTITYWCAAACAKLFNVWTCIQARIPTQVSSAWFDGPMQFVCATSSLLRLLCSTAGLRSGKYAAKLQREGFHDVRNLRGSLVSWVRSHALRPSHPQEHVLKQPHART